MSQLTGDKSLQTFWSHWFYNLVGPELGSKDVFKTHFLPEPNRNFSESMPGPRSEAVVSSPSSPAPQPRRQAQVLGGGSFPSPHPPSAVSGAEEGARCVCPAATAPFLEPTRAGLAPKGARV